MKHILLIGLCASLSACTMMTGTGTSTSGTTMATTPATSTSMATYNFTKQPALSADRNPSGKVDVDTSGSMVMTTATIMGLNPNTYYVAHFHNQGTAAANPCDSGGDPIMSSKVVAQTDAAGMLVLKGSVAKTEVMKATYFNVHTSKDADGTPADAGVMCTAVKM